MWSGGGNIGVAKVVDNLKVAVVWCITEKHVVSELVMSAAWATV